MSLTTAFYEPSNPPTPNQEATTEASVEWRAIPGYEGLYEVNEDDQVRVVKTGKILKPLPITEEFPVPRITLYKNGKYQRRRAHCWTTLAFDGIDQKDVKT